MEISPPPPLLATLPNAAVATSPPIQSTDQMRVDLHRSAPSPSLSLSPNLLIVAAIIVFVVVASASIHLLLRFLSFRRNSSSSVAALPLPHSPPSVPATSSAATVAAEVESSLSDQEKAALIESLPVFSLASALSVLPKSSLDCAVCLCPFRADDELRLLPACGHAFHTSCVDPWLRTTPSCPLCRASITLPSLVLPPLHTSGDPVDAGSGSFRIEIGSVSRRRAPSSEEPGNPPPHRRSYSIGSSFEYMMEEEMDATVARIVRRREKVENRGEANVAPAPPGEEVAMAVGGGGVGGGRIGWLRERVDRLASSASSSFSSLRLSGRWSHRYDGEGGRGSWDLDVTARREAEEGGYYGFYRWLVGT